ncbi:Retrovirus-related Pol polyprotein from transposon TNT 1-94 [Vitis vinifera]|uniref:Retrovirus-related Pol polyprotein from transposon TNT 1-94 n=1 Tax=Vitis vinifera TaxID=29760 RepID=A0A438C7H2_VITVI|nr:Retrovirus-related Pol polyprotein from transposon TNT 1-94 [Vitis vinifera]
MAIFVGHFNLRQKTHDREAKLRFTKKTDFHPVHPSPLPREEQDEDLHEHFDVVADECMANENQLEFRNFRLQPLHVHAIVKRVLGLVENGIPAAAEGLTDAQRKNIEDQKLKDLKAKNYLFQAIDRSRAHLQALRKEFEILHMKAGESVNEYFARTLTIANKMKANGDDKGDVAVVEKILRSMTPKFDYVVCSIEESKDIDTLTIDELQSSLLVHEQRMSSHEEEEHALKITHGEQSGGRGRGRGSFRGRGRGRGRQSFDKAIVECYYCHKLGHFQWECPSKKKEANYAQTQEEMLLMSYVDMNKANEEYMWFLDSGCSNHMCGKKEYFLDFDGSFRDSVKLGNNSSMVVMGKGNVRLQVNGRVQIITGVFYVPELKNNLLSIGQLQEKG